MKALIIDDEKKARILLKTILIEYCPEVEEILLAENLIIGTELIKKNKPDVVFLDIEMPEHSGLQILDFVEKEFFDFEIIFTTAYSKYAIKAFEFSAIDYLLKPLRPKLVQKSIQKIISKSEKTQLRSKLNELADIFKSLSLNKIAIPFKNGVNFFQFDEIHYFEADSMYTKVHIATGQVLLVSKPLKYFDTVLNNSFFYRPHRSFIINVKKIKQFIRKDGAYIVMENGDSIPISKDKKEEFLLYMGRM